MKKTQIVLVGFLVVLGMTLMGCATAPVYNEGNATPLQRELNEISDRYPIPIAGKDAVIKFAGDAWKGTVGGKDAVQGTGKFETTAAGTTITIVLTHIWSDKENPVTKKPVGWVKSPTKVQIVLEYKEGPPASLTVKK
jgi:hypothetical protein